MQSLAQLHEGTLPHGRTPCAGDVLRHFHTPPCWLRKKRSPSWARGLTIPRLPVTGLSCPPLSAPTLVFGRRAPHPGAEWAA